MNTYSEYLASRRIPSSVGPQGPKGLQGNVGLKGPIGPIGPTGPMGQVGYIKILGCTGPPGENGLRGIRGHTGLNGPRGHKGVQGLKGDTGPTGDPGSTGYTGMKGDMGNIGPRGYTGIKGDTGIKGNTGPTGNNGSTGPTGPSASSYVIGIYSKEITLTSPASFDYVIYESPDIVVPKYEVWTYTFWLTLNIDANTGNFINEHVYNITTRIGNKLINTYYCYSTSYSSINVNGIIKVTNCDTNIPKKIQIKLEKGPGSGRFTYSSTPKSNGFIQLSKTKINNNESKIFI